MSLKFAKFGEEIKGGFILVLSLMILSPFFTLKLQGEEKKLTIRADNVDGMYDVSKRNEAKKKQLDMKKEEPNYD